MSVIFLFLLMLSGVVLKISALHLIKIPPMNCSQEGLKCEVLIGNCSDEGLVVERIKAPASPVVTAHVRAKKDDSGQFVPVIDLGWTQLPDSCIYSLKGTEVRVFEIATNHSVCLRYMFRNNLSETKNLKGDMWTFSLDRIVLIPGFKYQVFVTNLPKPDTGSYTKITNITVPERLWDAQPKWSVRKNKEKILVVTVEFKSQELFDQYQISISSPELQPKQSRIVKDDKTFKKVIFTLEARQITYCNLDLVIRPLSIQSMKNCLDYRGKIDVCPFLSDGSSSPFGYLILVILLLLLAILAVIGCFFAFLQKRDSHKETPTLDNSTCTETKPEKNPVQEHKKVIIIYSLDHPLYKEIILKFCAFLRAKCGTDVTLDLLDFAWLSTIGRIQWLENQRERISKSSDKILILCSPGVHAKWKAMCGEHKVRLKEDERSTIGDMLTPALSLIVPDLVQASSFHKYMVAYFDDVCSEDDVPAPFNIMVKYKLMKHFEELYFRILDMEKHEPGKIKCIEGILESDYFSCPSGRALRDAIEVFQNYQMKNPNWFEMELLDSEDEDEEAILKSLIPVDFNCNPYQLIEEHKHNTFVNIIECANDEQVSKFSIAETAVILSEKSSVRTTDVHFSDSGLSSFSNINVKGLATKPVAQHALCLQPM